MVEYFTETATLTVGGDFGEGHRKYSEYLDHTLHGWLVSCIAVFVWPVVICACMRAIETIPFHCQEFNFPSYVPRVSPDVMTI